MHNPVALAAAAAALLGLGFFAGRASVPLVVVVSDIDEMREAPSEEADPGLLGAAPSPVAQAKDEASRDLREARGEIDRLRAALERRSEEPGGVSDAVRTALTIPLARLKKLAPGRYGTMTFEELAFPRELDLTGSEVKDGDLAWLPALPSLRTLQLRKTGITDDGLVHVAKLDDLDYLGLRETKISDLGLERVRGMQGLEGLDVNLTPVTDAGLAHVGRLTNLTFLRLNYTEFTDTGLAHRSSLKKLERLDLWATDLGDAPRHLADLGWLTHLELGATQVSKAWVDDFTDAHPDCYVRSRWAK